MALYGLFGVGRSDQRLDKRKPQKSMVANEYINTKGGLLQYIVRAWLADSNEHYTNTHKMA